VTFWNSAGQADAKPELAGSATAATAASGVMPDEAWNSAWTELLGAGGVVNTGGATSTGDAWVGLMTCGWKVMPTGSALSAGAAPDTMLSAGTFGFGGSILFLSLLKRLWFY